MVQNFHRGKIVFVDDQPNAIESFVEYLNQEGFTHTVCIQDVKSFRDLEDEHADLLFLDITGVASKIDPDRQGVAVLEHLKKYQPWCRVVVLSGDKFSVSKTSEFSAADLCLTKSSLDLDQIRRVTEEQLILSLSPEYRNLQLLRYAWSEIDSARLGAIQKYRLKRLLNQAITHEGNDAFNWAKLARKSKGILSGSANMATIIGLFVA